MAKNEKAEVISKGDRISLWFPDAETPSLRSFPSDADVEMTMSKTEAGWGLYVGLDGKTPDTAVAIYGDEKSASDALSRTAMILGGYKPKDGWWYARWTAVLVLLSIIAAMEIYFAMVDPEDLLAADAAISAPGAFPGGGSSLPGTSFGGGGSQAAAASPFAGGYGNLPSGPAPGAIGAVPGTGAGAGAGIQPPQQPGGLSAFGLDDRSPPGGATQQNPLFDLDNN